jgi:hypothetical protein
MAQGGMAQRGMAQGGMVQELTFSRFAELLLARTYEREQRDGPGEFDTRELISDLVGQVPDAWLSEAAELLRDQGLVLAFTTDAPGFAQVRLTPAGRVFVDQEQSPTIRDYRNSPQIVVVTGDGNQVSVGHSQTVQQSGAFEQQEALDLLHELEERLNASELPDTERADALADVETIRAQMKKEKPNLAVIKTTLAALRAIGVVADLVEKLGGVIH